MKNLQDYSEMHLPRETSNNSSYSPSFNSYFNTDLAQIAARVTTEFIDHEDSDLIHWPEVPSASDIHDIDSNHNTENRNQSRSDEKLDNNDGGRIDDDDDSEFEFDLANLIPANGEIRPVYPVFNRDLLRGSNDLVGSTPLDSDESSKAQIQLKTLFLGEDRDDPPASPSSSSSDSEADELESIPPGTHCVWTPNESPSPSGRCTKSNSTGSAPSSSSSAAAKSKAWKLRDLLKRSNSDGMLITPSSKQKKAEPAKGNSAGGSGNSGGVTARPKAAARRSYEYYYARRVRERENSNIRRRSYLPYKQDLVGFFVSPQGLRKMHLPPF